MDFILAAIGIIAFFLVIGVIFRLVTYTLKVVSLVLLLLLLLAAAGSYLQVQAYVLPAKNAAYLVVADEFFVVDAVGRERSYDPAASAAFRKELLTQGIATAGTASLADDYRSLRSFAKDDLFASYDTIWLVDARGLPCASEAVEQDPSSFDAACLAQRPGVSQLITSKGKDALRMLPLKSSFTQWLKNSIFSKEQ